MKIYLDGCDISDIKKFNSTNLINGFTTNPTLMANAGIKNYEIFSKKLLSIVKKKPVSLEIFSDKPKEIIRQAKIISSWQNNVFVKIPVLNSKGQDLYSLIEDCIKNNIKINITAVFSLHQVKKIFSILKKNNLKTEVIISIFAGRIANTLRDPELTFIKAKKILKEKNIKNTKLLWASPREILNILHAQRSGADIITITPDLFKQFLKLRNKNLEEYSKETSKMFLDDAIKSNFKI